MLQIETKSQNERKIPDEQVFYRALVENCIVTDRRRILAVEFHRGIGEC